MTTENVKNHIKEAIQSFASGNLTKNGLNLFKTLGYNTERQAPLNKPTFSEFKESFISAEKRFDEEKALCSQWKYVDLLFQLSAEEMQHQESLFKATVEREDPASYLFFIIDLGVNAYSRNQLSQIVREVNKIFPMHVFIVFKYASEISLSLIDRRPNKRSDDRDVLEKVTHVYNINIANPHSGHVHILYSFSFEAISAESRKRRIESFKDLQSGWRRVISTDILNKQFYLNYSQLSVKLIKVVFPDRVKSKLITHQGVLNLLNRIMFLYFVQKKRWLMNDDNFIIHYWNRYKDSGQSNKFHEHWLNTLFFNAFNGKAWEAFKSFKFLPDEIQEEITNFPYLNGGLFLFNKEYDGFILEDKYFEEIFNFFESFIFTITEDTPFDVNLEINPELLGKMYESMINATDLDDVEAENGIIYTERPEINFMTRRSFVEVLDKKLNNKLSREFLYHFIFDDHAQKKEILKRYKVNLLALRQAICTLTVCDPACGSGSMLLGVLQLQMELLRVIDETDKKPHSEKDDFLIKKQLVSDCLYGVDIKEWAVRIAELRLWLYMIAEADFSQEERIKAPLLPNLDFKLRKGNSLLQKIGSLDFSVEDLLNSAKNKNAGASRRLREFIKKKKEFIINQEESNTTYEKLKKEEYEVFYGFIKELIFENENKLSNIGKRGKQLTIIPEPEQIDLELYAEDKESLRVEIEKLKKLKTSIHKEGKLPFSFEIDFMEIFLASDDPGFDLVIGNPPYVRQEQILPPEDGEYLEYLLLPENRHEKAKVNNQYKEILNEKVFKTYPFLSTSFKTKIEEKNKSIPVYGNKVPGRSDLYCYFQLICPSYLNSKGTFCFIISNSWLDVEFGAFVQHFLLKHTVFYGIYDCNVRSFDASINTVIYLHSSLINRFETNPIFFRTLKPAKCNVPFIMNQVDYTQLAYAPLLLEQENCQQNTFRNLYRVIVLDQNELFENAYDDDEFKFRGDKWGGKYLRAPEIYYTILEKGGSKFIKLKELTEVKFGVKTGANEFFYLDAEKIDEFKLENRFLRKIIKSPRDFESILITNNQLSTFAFNSFEPKQKLKGSNALNYIEWGEQSVITEGIETRAFNRRPSCNRQPWYSFEEIAGNTFWGKELRERLAVFCSDEQLVADCRLYVATLSKKQQAILNSSLGIFIDETLGRQLGGGGGPRSVMVYEIKNLPVLKADLFSSNALENTFDQLRSRKIMPFLEELGFNRNLNIRDQKPNPISDRKALDDIIFDQLDLTIEERTEVYWSLGELVKQRLDKAASR